MQSAKFILLGVVLVAFLAASLVKTFKESDSPTPKPLPRAETLIDATAIPNTAPEYVDISLAAVNLTTLPFKTGLYVQGPDQQLQSVPLSDKANASASVTAETIDGKLLLYTDNRAKTLALDMPDATDLRVLFTLKNNKVHAQLSDISTDKFPAGYVRFFNMLDEATYVRIDDQTHKIEPGQHALVDVSGATSFNVSCVIEGQQTPAFVQRRRLPAKCRLTVCLVREDNQLRALSIVDYPPPKQTHQN